MRRHDNARLFRDGVSRGCEEVATGIDSPLNACGVQRAGEDIADGAFLCRWARRVDEGCEELDACFHTNIVTPAEVESAQYADGIIIRSTTDSPLCVSTPMDLSSNLLAECHCHLLYP